MAKTFYDKDVHLLEKRIEMDAEGGVKTNGYSVRTKFKGNVNFSNCEKIQEDYGLDYKVNISITTDHNDVSINDILSYDTILYEVKGVYTRDSHTLVLGTLWRV